MGLRQYSNAIRTNFIGYITVRGYAIRSHKYRFDATMTHEMTSHIISNQGKWHALLLQFPGCQARAL